MISSLKSYNTLVPLTAEALNRIKTEFLATAKKMEIEKNKDPFLFQARIEARVTLDPLFGEPTIPQEFFPQKLKPYLN